MEGIDTSEWSQADFAQYAEWQKEAHGRDDYDRMCAEDFLLLVEEEGIHPTEVGSYLHDKSDPASF